MSLSRAVLYGAMLVAAHAGQAMTLDDAIVAALALAPALKAASADADAAGARLRAARGAGGPVATLSGTVGVGRLDPQRFFALGAENVVPRVAQIGVEQPLYAGGRIGAGIAQAMAGEAAARATERATEGDLLTAVVRAYGDALATGRRVQLQRDLLAEMRELERHARLRYRAGESPRTDIAQAAARVAEAEANMAVAEGGAAVAGAHFTRLTGLRPRDLLPLPPNPALPARLSDAIEAARRANPALAGARADLAAAEAGVHAAHAERRPALSAFVEGTTTRDQFFPDYRADSAAVGLRARWQFFDAAAAARVDGGNSRVRAAQARLDAAMAEVDEQVLVAFQQVRTSELIEGAAARQAEATTLARDSIRHEVRVGMKPQIDLLDAEREAVAASVAVAEAATARAVAAYRLLGLIGGQGTAATR